MAGIRVTKSKKKWETLTDPSAMTHDPYVSVIDSYTSSIALADAMREGTLKKIYNDSGETISITFSDLQGSGSDQLDMLDNTWVEVMFVYNEDTTARYRVVDGSLTGLTEVA